MQGEKDWRRRFWSLWGAVDLVQMGDKDLWVAPGFINPMTNAGEIAICGRNQARSRSRRLLL